jgi:ATP-dependent RNA helicase RhlE
MSFKNIGLKEPILKALQQKGYKEPTPIQQLAISSILKNKDVMAAAQTGYRKNSMLYSSNFRNFIQQSRK